ncbi:MAG: ROK family protein [Chloroflexi bacterium]|nr:MAG: ROK family protein [Chloroflexota bacterium]
MIGAVDIGGTKIAAGLVDTRGQIIARQVVPTDRDKDFETALGHIHRMLTDCMERHPERKLIGIGVGCTGPIDPETGVLGPKSFLPLWEGSPTLPRLEETFKLPVAMENDADAAALGEVAWGAGQGALRCVYVTVSTGIGCGMILDGRVYRGAGGAHPELGHVIIDPSLGPACYCGGRGCWESLASGTALADWYSGEIIRRGLPDRRGLPAGSPVDAWAVCSLAEQGDALAQEAVVREGYYLGIGLANLITTFVPDVIVLGGGVMESWRLFEGQVWATIRQTCGLVPYERTHLRLASLGSRTGLAGAGQVLFHRFG